MRYEEGCHMLNHHGAIACATASVTKDSYCLTNPSIKDSRVIQIYAHD